MPDPITIAAAELPEFLGRAPLAVLLVSLHPVHAFSPALARQLEIDHGAIALGTVDVRDLLTDGGPGLRLLYEGFRTHAGYPVLPGYCLFRGRTMLAWDAGLPDAADFAVIAQGTVIGAICSGVTRDPAFLRRALRSAAGETAAVRVATRFRAAVAEPAAEPDREPSSSSEDALVWAYRTLGVAPAASDEEVHHAWKRLRIAHHPDHAAGDAAEFGRRSRLSADVNRARDIIQEWRARARPAGGYARAS